jgi:hypothetical protein
MAGHGVRTDTPLQESDRIKKEFGITGMIGDAAEKKDKVNLYYYMTGDSSAECPWVEGIPMDVIRHALDGIPARQKLLLIDTCQSGEDPRISGYVPSEERLREIRKKRGIITMNPDRKIRLVQRGIADKRAIETAVARALDMKEMSDMFPELRRGTGTIEISAATGVQAALEDKEWNNGAFTYVIKEAVLNERAKDAGGRITAKSLRRYVLKRVEVLTDGDQTPMVCRDIPGRDFTIFEK